MAATMPAPTRTNAQIVGEAVGALELTRFHWVLWVGAASVYAACACTAGVMPFVMQSIREELELSPFDEGVLSSCIFWGMAVGSVLSGPASDLTGRRPLLLTSLLMLALVQLAIGAVGSARGLAIVFLLRGVVYLTCENVSKSLLAECLPTDRRGLLLNAIHPMWQVGAALGIATTLLGHSYRVLGPACALAPAISLLVTSAVSIESPMWLLQARGPRAAQDSISALTAKCGLPPPAAPLFGPAADVELTSTPGTSQRQAEPEPSSSSNDLRTLPPSGRKVGLRAASMPRACLRYATRELRVLLHPDLRTLSLITSSLWACLAFAALSNDFLLIRYLAFTGRAELERAVTLAMYGFKLLGGVLGAGVVDRIGRRRVLIPCFLATAAGTLLFVAARSTPVLFLGLCVLYMANEVLWSTVMTYTCEAFPTSIRANAVGVLVATGRIAAAIGVAVGPELMTMGAAVPFALNALIFTLGAGLSAWLPSETSGKPMT